MEAPDLNAVISREDLRELLSPEDKKLLQYFIVNLRARRKREKEAESKRSDMQHGITEKGRNFVGQETYELHQDLLMRITEAERAQLIREAIESNIYMFLKYMETY